MNGDGDYVASCNVGTITHMPKLSFLQLTRIFIAGFIGYAVLGSLVIIGAAVVFPDYVKGRFDMDIYNFLKMMFVYSGVFGLTVTPFMLIGARGILRLLRPRA